MPIYEFKNDAIIPLAETEFASHGIQERRDIQRILRSRIEVVAPNAMVIADEFGEWEDSKRRVDMLVLDKDANLVVVELKRTEDGGHMELQAVRYASMVSTMTFDQVVAAHGRYLAKIGKAPDGARDAILEFLGWDEPDDDVFAQNIRIVLASAEFSKELISSVLWLIDHGIDISCVRMKPYSLGDQLFIDVQQIVPLPEAADYQFQVREKAEKERAARVSHADYTRFDVSIDGKVHQSVAKRIAIYHVCKHLCDNGVTPEEIARLFTWRNNAWYCVDGVVDPDEFARLAGAKAKAGGPTFDRPRWFCDDGELVHSNGKTYAVSKMWGGENWRRAMNALKAAFHEHNIDFGPTS